MIIYV